MKNYFLFLFVIIAFFATQNNAFALTPTNVQLATIVEIRIEEEYALGFGSTGLPGRTEGETSVSHYYRADIILDTGDRFPLLYTSASSYEECLESVPDFITVGSVVEVITFREGGKTVVDLTTGINLILGE